MEFGLVVFAQDLRLLAVGRADLPTVYHVTALVSHLARLGVDYYPCIDRCAVVFACAVVLSLTCIFVLARA
jgi:hypothetical protein